ncbi:MAG: hypothetical protein JL50_21405 [Peptococcaceae bacterium BICA1-7]|nr:MAG: hypothetical protein JL50_21405 [Peptococcaceae bacterium BICA1-7]HBV97113.1 hypothetical protein [Desulfotomaculum sp.]
MKKFILAVALSVVLALGAGCGGTKTIKTDEGTVKVDNNKVEVTTNDGGKSQISVNEPGGISLPEDYPKEIVPIIADGKIVLASKNEDPDKRISYWVTVNSPKDPKEVYGFYQEALKDATETQKTEVNNDYFISGIKGDRSFTVSVSSEENEGVKGSVIQIVVLPKE